MKWASVARWFGAVILAVSALPGSALAQSCPTQTICEGGGISFPIQQVLSPIEGIPYGGPWPAFWDSNLSDTADSFSNATLSWGRTGFSGQPVFSVSAQVHQVPSDAAHAGVNTFVVSPASQPVVFPEGGVYVVYVNADHAGSEPLTGDTPIAEVTDAPIVASAATAKAVANTPFSGTIATFQDVPGSTPGDYSVTIDWSDGSPLDRAASVTLKDGQVINNQVFNVTGTVIASHTYSQIGSYTPKVTITDTGFATANVSSSITVTCAQVSTTDRYATTILADAPLGYWRLSDANHCAADSSGHFDSGLASAGVTPGQTGALSAAADTAMFFDGSSGFVALGDPSTLQPSQQLSVEAWIRTRAAGAPAIIVRKRLYGYELFLDADGVANFGIFDANATEYTARGNPVTDGAWHHLVGTYDGSNVCIYVDGRRLGCAAAGKVYYQPDQVAIGRDGGFSGSYFNGSIDEVAIYGAALSQTQVQSHFAAAH